MNVTLSPALQKFVDAKVGDGTYETPSEVVREALRLLQEREQFKEFRLQRMRQIVQEGLDDLAQGRYDEYSDETLPRLVDRIEAEGRKRLQARKRRQA
jgi:antitoxin ParD1/3/4